MRRQRAVAWPRRSRPRNPQTRRSVQTHRLGCAGNSSRQTRFSSHSIESEGRERKSKAELRAGRSALPVLPIIGSFDCVCFFYFVRGEGVVIRFQLINRLSNFQTHRRWVSIDPSPMFLIKEKESEKIREIDRERDRERERERKEWAELGRSSSPEGTTNGRLTSTRISLLWRINTLLWNNDANQKRNYWFHSKIRWNELIRFSRIHFKFDSFQAQLLSTGYEIPHLFFLLLLLLHQRKTILFPFCPLLPQWPEFRVSRTRQWLRVIYLCMTRCNLERA